MRALRKLLLGTCILAAPLAVAAAAQAQQLYPGVTLYNSQGQPVAVVAPMASPMAPAMGQMPDAGFFARQNAMMQRMIANMQQMNRAMFNGPINGPMFQDPDRLIQAAMRQMGADGSVQPGTSMVTISTFNAGKGSCSQMVTYSYASGASQPQVAVHQVGDACSSISMPQMRTVPAATPASQPPLNRLIRVDDQQMAHG